jgi:hypothetical protein
MLDLSAHQHPRLASKYLHSSNRVRKPVEPKLSHHTQSAKVQNKPYGKILMVSKKASDPKQPKKKSPPLFSDSNKVL